MSNLKIIFAAAFVITLSMAQHESNAAQQSEASMLPQLPEYTAQSEEGESQNENASSDKDAEIHDRIQIRCDKNPITQKFYYCLGNRSLYVAMRVSCTFTTVRDANGALIEDLEQRPVRSENMIIFCDSSLKGDTNLCLHDSDESTLRCDQEFRQRGGIDKITESFAQLRQPRTTSI